MKNIAVIYPFIPHYRSAIMQRLVENKDHEFTMVCSRHDPVDEIPVWLPDADFIETRTIDLPGLWIWQTGLLKLALSRKFDTLIFRGNVYCASTWYAAPLARLLGKRVIYWGHGWIRNDRGLRKVIRQLFYSFANAFLYYGKRGRDLGIKFGFNPEETYVVNNSQNMLPALDLTGEQIRRIRAEYFDDPTRATVICSTRIQKRKKIDQLLEAVGKIEDSVRPNVIIVGDGPDRATLEKLASDLNVDCHFFGACYDETVMQRLYSISTVAVCPAAVGLSAIHSMNYGVPMVTNDDFDKHGPEYESIVDGRTGSFFAVDEIDSLTEHIKQWTTSDLPSPATRDACIAMVRDQYSAEYQEKIILKSIHADDSESIND